MDKNRQIRLLIPPFFVIASLLWGSYVGGLWYHYIHATALSSDATILKVGLSIFGLVGVTTLPAGYAIGIITITALRFMKPFFHSHNYELPVSQDAMKEIWKYFDSKRKPSLDLCAAATFDHVYLQENVHEWILRRWTAFHIATQCVTALVLSLIFAHAFHIPLFYWNMWKWWAPVALLILIFVLHSVKTWREVRTMFDFAVYVPEATIPEASLRAHMTRHPYNPSQPQLPLRDPHTTCNSAESTVQPPKS